MESNSLKMQTTQESKMKNSYEVKVLPKVSIIIPVYNHEKYIRECVESALAQDYENLEVIVVDDGSTDGTPEILKEFGERINYIRQENQGTSAALNTGLRHAQGSLVGWLSSDDLYLPGKIKYQVEKFRGEPSLGLVYTDWIKIDSQGREIQMVHSPCPSSEHFVGEMLKGNFVNGSSALIRKECFEKAGYFDTGLAAGSDVDMWFRLLKNGYRFGHVPRPLIKYRWHPSNLSHNYKLLQTCKDQVRLKVIQTFSPQELFGDFVQERQSMLGAAYDGLAWTLARQFTFKAAHMSIGKAIEVNGLSWQRAFLSATLRLLDTRLFKNMLAFIRKTRRFWIDKRQQGRLTSKG